MKKAVIELEAKVEGAIQKLLKVKSTAQDVTGKDWIAHLDLDDSEMKDIQDIFDHFNLDGFKGDVQSTFDLLSGRVDEIAAQMESKLNMRRMYEDALSGNKTELEDYINDAIMAIPFDDDDFNPRKYLQEYLRLRDIIASLQNSEDENGKKYKLDPTVSEAWEYLTLQMQECKEIASTTPKLSFFDDLISDINRSEKFVNRFDEILNDLISRGATERGSGVASEAETDAIRKETEELEKNTEAVKENQEAKDSAASTDSQQAQTDATREDTEETEKNTEAHKENEQAKESSSAATGSQQAQTDATREDTSETEKNTEAHKENEQAKESSSTTTGSQEAQTDATREDTSETEKNTEAHKENQQAKETTGKTEGQSSSTQQTREDTEETERNTEAHQKNREECERSASQTAGEQAKTAGESARQTASDLEAEISALNRVGDAAFNAAMKKDVFSDANRELAEAAKKSSSALGEEASGFEKVGKSADESSKKKSKAKKTTEQSAKDAEKSAEDIQREKEAKATAEAEDYISRLKTIRAKSSDYYKNLRFMSVNDLAGNETSPVTQSVRNYESEVRSIIAGVNDLSDAWNGQNAKVNEASRLAKEYLLDMSTTISRDDIVKQAQQQLDTIERAKAKREQQGSGFDPEYLTRLEEAEAIARRIADEAQNLNLDKSFDTSKITGWVQELDKGRQTLKEINDQENLLATKGSLDKLLGKVNQDIGKGGLRGGLAAEYDELREKVKAAISSLNESGDAAEKVSKVDLRKLTDSYQELNSKAKEFGQLQGGFSSKFAEAINNQSAQFLATYFSFQDMIRYAREITQTVVQTDSALVELRKVSDASNERIQQSFTTSAQTAQELGSTITDVINNTSTWARLGYDVDAAEQLAKTTTLFQTVGDNMTQETASEALVSTLKGFQMDADQALSIVDKFNEVNGCL